MFISHKLWCLMDNFLSWVFLMFRHAPIFFSFIVVCTHLRCYITSDVHLIMCALCEKNDWKYNEPKNEGCNIHLMW